MPVGAIVEVASIGTWMVGLDFFNGGYSMQNY
jgi:hypothetical protein